LATWAATLSQAATPGKPTSKAQPDHQRARTPVRDEIPAAGLNPPVIYNAADGLLGVGVVGVGDGVVGVGDGVVGVGVGDGGCVCVGKLLCGEVGVGEGADAGGLLRTGDVVAVLFVGPGTAVGLLVALPSVPWLLPWPCAELVADRAGLLVVEPAPDLPVLCGFAPVRPEVGVLPTLGVVSGDAAE
jgi:hypothetical protein